MYAVNNNNYLRNMIKKRKIQSNLTEFTSESYRIPLMQLNSVKIKYNAYSRKKIQMKYI